MSSLVGSIHSSLPTLKCTYQMAPIVEEQPYIALEDMVSDNHYNYPKTPRDKWSERCCSLFCFHC